MRLLVVAHDLHPDPGSGGTGRYVHETGRRLAARGHDVSVLTRRRGEVPLRETMHGMQVARYEFAIDGEPWSSVLAQIPSALATIRDHLDELPEPEILSFQATVGEPLVDHLVSDDVARSATLHSPWSLEHAIKAGARGQGPRPRETVGRHLRRRLERGVLEGCEQTITLSRFMAERLADVHGPIGDPIVIPGGVDTDRFHPRLDETQVSSERDLTLLTVRRLSPRMGHGELLEAFARSAASEHGELFIAGEGPLRDEVEQQAARLGVHDRTRFFGYVPEDELGPLLAGADLFVLPTQRLEGFGLATLEAMAAGTPVLATPVGGTKELLGGLERRRELPAPALAAASTAAALAEGIDAWARLDDDQRRKAGELCRRYVEQRYTWEATTDRLEEAYERLLSEDG